MLPYKTVMDEVSSEYDLNDDFVKLKKEPFFKFESFELSCKEVVVGFLGNVVCIDVPFEFVVEVWAKNFE